MKWIRFKRDVRGVFAPARPGEVPSRGFMGYSPNEADGGTWAKCSVCGDLSRHRTVNAAFEAERSHWASAHVGG
jgi:hypothetical protein